MYRIVLANKAFSDSDEPINKLKSILFSLIFLEMLLKLKWNPSSGHDYKMNTPVLIRFHDWHYMLEHKYQA